MLTAEVMSGRSVILPTLFLGKPSEGNKQYLVYILRHLLATALLESAEEEERPQEYVHDQFFTKECTEREGRYRVHRSSYCARHFRN